jgi:hypothetical protein
LCLLPSLCLLGLGMCASPTICFSEPRIFGPTEASAKLYLFPGPFGSSCCLWKWGHLMRQATVANMSGFVLCQVVAGAVHCMVAIRKSLTIVLWQFC